MLRLPLLLLACVSLVAISGCDATDDETYDSHTERIERQLAEIIPSDYGFKVESVTCPDDMDLSIGETYECQVTTPSGQTEVAVMKSESKRTASIVKVTKPAGNRDARE